MNTKLNTTKKKLCLVISSELYVRNYIDSKVFEVIKNSYEICILLNEEIRGAVLDNSRIYKYSIPKNDEKKHYELFNLLMWKHRKKSKSFSFRAKRVFGLNLQVSQNFGFLKKLKRKFGIFVTWFFNYFRLSILSLFPFYEIYIKLKSTNFGMNPSILEALEKEEPSLVLIPCSAYDPVGDEVVLSAKKLGIKTFFLVDNWDNLSSKTIMRVFPDYLGVWGNQSLSHADKIQKFPKDKIVIIGTPRFEAYFSYRNLNLKSHFNFKYLLFVGTSLPFNEHKVLKCLDNIIKRNQSIFEGIKIVYRPHPWRLSGDIVSEDEFDNVVIDPQIKKNYLGGDKSVRFQPSLDYYPSLLKNCEFIVGGLTTMLMEGTIFYKKILVVAYGEENNLTSPKNVLENYTNFEGIEDLPNLEFLSYEDKLEQQIINCLNTRNCINKDLIDQKREFFVYHSDQGFASKLVNEIAKILK